MRCSLAPRNRTSGIRHRSPSTFPRLLPGEFAQSGFLHDGPTAILAHTSPTAAQRPRDATTRIIALEGRHHTVSRFSISFSLLTFGERDGLQHVRRKSARKRHSYRVGEWPLLGAYLT
jgi:hypothetical protein